MYVKHPQVALIYHIWFDVVMIQNAESTKFYMYSVWAIDLFERDNTIVTRDYLSLLSRGQFKIICHTHDNDFWIKNLI